MEDLKHAEASEKAGKARRTGSRESLQKGGIILAPEARNMVVKRQEDELAQAKAIVDKAEQTQIKTKRKALLTAVATTRRDMLKISTAQKNSTRSSVKRFGPSQGAGKKTRHTFVDSFGCEVM